MACKYDEKQIRQDYCNLTKLLIQRHLTITTMESATSGQIASLITDCEGSSEVFYGAFITYSNESKIMNGVSREVIDKYSVYSKQTAAEMARVCREKYNADIGIGVTGTMGNVDKINYENSIPGQVYFAVSYKDSVTSYFVRIPAQQSRLAYKLAVAREIYDVLINMIM